MTATVKQEIKALRFQMAKLEEKCKAREDKVIRLIVLLQPFLTALTPEMTNKLLEELDLMEPVPPKSRDLGPF